MRQSEVMQSEVMQSEVMRTALRTTRRKPGHDRTPGVFWSAVVFTPVVLVGLLLAAPVSARSLVHTAKSGVGKILDFGPSEPAWSAVNDGVMGGVSRGGVATRGGVLVFRGAVSLENNGGFASARSGRMPKGSAALIGQATEFVVRLRGDGKMYRFTVSPLDGPDWYWAEVATESGVWREVRIPFAELRPRTRFGEPTVGPGYDGRPLQSVGVLIFNKRAEVFRLSLDWIGVA